MKGVPPRLGEALRGLRDRVSPAFSRASSAPLQNILAGVVLSVAVVLALVVAIYLTLIVRGAFGNGTLPHAFGLMVLALLHGATASVTVPPIPELFGIGGSVVLGLPLTSFALLPFVLLLVSSRYVARRTEAGAILALSTTTSYALLIGLLAALGGGKVGTDGETSAELGAGPFSAGANGFLLAGIATALGVTATHSPLLPTRARQVVRGTLAAIGVSVALALVLAVLVTVVQVATGSVPEPPPADSSPADAPPRGTEDLPWRDALNALGWLVAMAPSALGTVWLLAHGVPVGVQGADALAGLPLIGPALADTPLKASLLGRWPFAFGWRLLLLGPVVGFVVGGMVAVRGAPRTQRWWQGALIAAPYTLVAFLVAVHARVTADLTLAGANLSVAFGASLPWLLLLLPIGGLLGALGGHASMFGDDVSEPRPQRAFLATTGVCAVVLLLSLPALFGSSPPRGQDLLGAASSGEEAPDLEALGVDPPEQEEEVSPEAREPEPLPSDPDPPEPSEEGPRQAGVGERLTVGDAGWVVLGAKKRAEIRAQEDGEVRQGDFMVVNFELTNSSDEPKEISPSSIGLIGKSGRRFEVLPDLSRFVPPERDPSSRPVEPRTTLKGRVIFEVTPKASGFRLQLGDGQPLPPENGYVDLGI